MSKVGNLIRFLNDNAGAFSVIFSFVVMLATVVYAALTRQLVRETERLRKVETDPNISIYLEPEERWINLVDLILQNNGRGAAYDVKFTIDPDFECRRGKRLSSLPLMQRIKYLAPGQKVRFFLASAVDVFARDAAGRAFKIQATYKNAMGQPFHETFDLNFDDFREMETIGEPPLHKIAKAIDEIRKDVGHAMSGFNKLNVELWTQADIDKTREERERWRDEQIKKAKGDTQQSDTPS